MWPDPFDRIGSFPASKDSLVVSGATRTCSLDSSQLEAGEINLEYVVVLPGAVRRPHPTSQSDSAHMAKLRVCVCVIGVWASVHPPGGALGHICCRGVVAGCRRCPGIARAWHLRRWAACVCTCAHDITFAGSRFGAPVSRSICGLKSRAHEPRVGCRMMCRSCHCHASIVPQSRPRQLGTQEAVLHSSHVEAYKHNTTRYCGAWIMPQG